MQKCSKSRRIQAAKELKNHLLVSFESFVIGRTAQITKQDYLCYFEPVALFEVT
jgi:hypothetical protein